MLSIFSCIYELVYVILERDPKRLHSLALFHSFLGVLPLACLLCTFMVALSVFLLCVLSADQVC